MTNNKPIFGLLIFLVGFQINLRGQCATDMDAGPDIDICPNEGYMSYRMQAVVSGSFSNPIWTPSANLDNPFILNPLVTVNSTETYTLSVTSLDNLNLIDDGDFEKSDEFTVATTFTSDYDPVTNNPLDIEYSGSYVITRSRPNPCNIGDHTFESIGMGNLLVVNGAETGFGVPRKTYFWCQNIVVEPLTDYVFQYWIANLDKRMDGKPPEIRAVITENNLNMSRSVIDFPSGPDDPCVWERNETIWNSGLFTGSVELCLSDLNQEEAGNFFAIDDISMNKFCGETLIDDITITLAEMPSARIDTTICTGGDIRIDGELYTSSGFHEIILHENDSECDTLVNLTIDEFNAEAFIYSGSTEISCFVDELPLEGDYDSNINLDPNIVLYEWSTLDGNITSDPNLQFILVDKPGEYKLTINVDDPSISCTTIAATITITDIRSTPPVMAGPDRVIGCGVTSIELDASGSGTPPEHSASWTTLNGNITLNEQTLAPTVDAAGIYILEISNESNGCSSLDTMEVTIDQMSPEIIAPSDLNFDCSQNMIEIDASGSTSGPDITIDWSVVGGGSLVSDPDSLVVEISGAGTYTLTLQDTTNDCSVSHDVVVSGSNTGPSIDDPINRQLDCDSTIVTLIGGYNGSLSGYTIAWSTTNGNILSPNNQRNIRVDQAGDYQITVTNTSTSCFSTSMIQVTQDANLPQANAGSSQIIDCSSSMVNLSGSGSSGSNVVVNWSTSDGNIVSGHTTFSPSVNSAGRYYLSVSNTTNGCMAIDSVDVTTSSGLPNVNIQSADTLNCLMDQIQLDGTASSSGGSFSPSWTTNSGNILLGANSLTPDVNAPGTYTLTVTNTTNNCSNSAQVMVEQFDNQPVARIATPTTLTCRDEQIILDAGLSSSGSSIHYAWATTTGNIVSGINTTQPTIDLAGSYTLTVVDDNSHCSTTAQVTVLSDTTIPTAEAGVGGTLDCANNQLPLDGSGSSSGLDYSINWTTSNGNVVSGQNSLTPLINAPGTYIITVENTNTGCQGIDSTTVDQSGDIPVANAGLGQQLNCNIDVTTLDGSGSDTGANFTYTWFTSNGNIVSGMNDILCMVDQVGNYTLEVINTDNGCSSSNSVEVTGDYSLPLVTANSPEVLSCTESIIQLDATGSASGSNITYQWNTLDGNIVSGSTTTEPRIDQIGTYTLVVIDGLNGCQDSVDVVVGQDASLPTVQITSPEELTCNNFSVELNGSNSSTGDFSYLWTTSNGNITGSPTALISEANQAGTYRLTVTNDQTGCDQFDEVTISENLLAPVISAGNDISLFCGQPSVQVMGSIIQSSGNTVAEWTTSDGSIIGNPFGLNMDAESAGLYELQVIDQVNGCESTDQMEVIFIDELFVDLDVIQPDCMQPVAVVDIADGMGTEPYQYSLNEGNSFKDFPIDNFEPETVFPMIIRDATGCIKRDTVITGSIGSVDVDITIPPIIQQGESIQLHALSSRPFGDLDSIFWSPPTYLNAINILNPTSTPEDNITYKVYVETYDHCIDSADVRVLVQIPLDYYIPNTFSPNRDNINDYWTIYGNDRVVLINSLHIFDRWGTLVFEGENLIPGDERAGWDGRFQGTFTPIGVYTYVTTLQLEDGEILYISGDLTVLR